MTLAPGDHPAETAPSGRQYTITDGTTDAVVTEVGASLREYRVGNEPVVWPYPLDAMAGGSRGQVLAPWPNRVEDGSYEFGGVRAHAPLDEPDRHNAIHGLVRWLIWKVTEHAGHRIALACELAPQPGYPWRLSLELAYELADGLVVSASAENRSSAPAPFGMGFHPYLFAGAAGVDGCAFSLPGEQRLLLDERGLPSGAEAVEGTAYDFRSGRPLAGAHLDDCFTRLSAPAEEPTLGGVEWQAVLERHDGRRVALWADASWPYVMCYTGDTLAEPDRRRGVAVEPMTCPPNALRTGESLIALAPGERWSGRFGIRLVQE